MRVEIWRSFELDCTAPHEHEGDLATLLADKYGMTVEEARERQRSVAELAAAEGITLRHGIARGAPLSSPYAFALRSGQVAS